jgi:hypothetical protein
MQNVLAITICVTLSFLTLSAILSYGTRYDLNIVAYAQSPIQSPFINNTETAAELDNLLGDDVHIIVNGTNIGNPNNTLPDSISVNIKEDCMQIPNSQHMYCP